HGTAPWWWMSTAPSACRSPDSSIRSRRYVDAPVGVTSGLDSIDEHAKRQHGPIIPQRSNLCMLVPPGSARPRGSRSAASAPLEVRNRCRKTLRERGSEATDTPSDCNSELAGAAVPDQSDMTAGAP